MSTANILHKELDLIVEYDYFRACRGSREKGSGIQLEPDEPENIEIISITLPDSKIDIQCLFNEDQLIDFQTEILEGIATTHYDAMYDEERDRRAMEGEDYE